MHSRQKGGIEGGDEAQEDANFGLFIFTIHIIILQELDGKFKSPILVASFSAAGRVVTRRPAKGAPRVLVAADRLHSRFCSDTCVIHKQKC